MRGFLSRIDPPEHGRLRELAARTVTWRVFADLEPRIATLTGEPPDAARERGRMELVEDPAPSPPDDRHRAVLTSLASAQVQPDPPAWR